ncbi:fatty acid desaturase [Qipengyuania sp. G39]|uniref:Fatty acid desaturase n=1 Tax=Qipengyuania profundimaris TaxID=3067652 RepID=A0ABT9HS14_9SPHN|nr:fatty acid desaturase [Qipengyuania sp. G39]MDP4575944.1 fatty acid desaturase [Qipengyuania sp. G39]
MGRPSVSTETAAGEIRQALTGLALTAAIFAAWLTIHLFAMFVFQLTWASLPLALVMAIVQCWLSVGMFIASHDAMHGSLVPGGGRINDVVGGFLLFVYAGFAWRRMRDAHFAHHKAPGTADDPDFSVDHPTRFWPWYGTFLKRYFGWQSIAFVSTVVTTYWLLLGVPVEKIVLLYGAPAIASSMQLFYFGTYRPHRHDTAGFDDKHHARSDDFGTLASLASCFHFGYHHEHHRAPHVPWWKLPAARKAMALEETKA